MKNTIIVHPKFDGCWPFVANHLYDLWQQNANETTSVEFLRLAADETRTIDQLIENPEKVERLISLMAPISADGLERFNSLKEAALYTNGYGRQPSDECLTVLERNGVQVHKHDSEGYWGQSVSEFALALTLCGLRSIPQGYMDMMRSHEPWNYDPPDGIGKPGARGHQFCDSTQFTSGTLAGKRVRIVGAGNIGSRYASFANFMGADVATWDPYANESSFHRAGTRRVHYLEQFMEDAEIFAPMVPLTDGTIGLITAEHIESLPAGCLVVLATRAKICDFDTIKRRVLNDEISLAADVFDLEPVPLDDPLIGRHNVIHTPHMAGRTRDANFRYAEALLEFFQPS